MENAQPITLLLRRVASGDDTAEEELFTAVYRELHNLAGWFIRRERPGHTLQPTALVNEAYLRMLTGVAHEWADRAHFLRIAGKVMRRILVDYARQRNAGKRSASLNATEIDHGYVSEERLDLIIAVDTALHRLERRDPRQARIVELHFFGGLTEEEIGLLLGVSVRTVKRDWAVAKAWLRADFNSKRSNSRI